MTWNCWFIFLSYNLRLEVVTLIWECAPHGTQGNPAYWYLICCLKNNIKFAHGQQYLTCYLTTIWSRDCLVQMAFINSVRSWMSQVASWPKYTTELTNKQAYICCNIFFWECLWFLMIKSDWINVKWFQVGLSGSDFPATPSQYPLLLYHSFHDLPVCSPTLHIVLPQCMLHFYLLRLLINLEKMLLQY